MEGDSGAGGDNLYKNTGWHFPCSFIADEKRIN
jgi:hypothetical protein